MLDYLRGEIYRVLRKKSAYIYFGCFAAGYFLLTFIIRSGGENADGMLLDAENLFGLLPPIVGGYLFAALYTDDLNSKNLTTLIGFGIGKTKITLSKLILMTVLGGAVFALIPLFMSGVYAVLGLMPTAALIGDVYVFALNSFMITLACAAISAIVVYGLQRATFGMVAYILLSFGIVSRLAAMLLNWEPIRNLLPGISEHTLFSIAARVEIGVLQGEASVLPVIEYIIYVAAATALAALAFRKKELEF